MENMNPVDNHFDVVSGQDDVSDEVVDFIANELEQQHLRISSLSKGLVQMERTMKLSTAEIATLAREQREKNGQHTVFMRRLEAEAARGSELRAEETRLRDSKLDRSLSTLRRDFEVKLRAVESLHHERLEQIEDKLEKLVVDVAVENQTLKTENMELRVILQQVMAAANRFVICSAFARHNAKLTPHCSENSNKKTLRVLTDEIVKMKRQVGYTAIAEETTAHRLERGIAKAFQVASPRQDLGR